MTTPTTPATVLREVHRLRRHAKELQDEIARMPRQLKAQQAKVARQEEAIKQTQEGIKKLKVLATEKEKSIKAKHQEIAKVQKDYMERLSKFVQDYPKCDDTPDALMQLGMMSELVNDEGPAKKWYELMIKDFGSHAQAGKAKGAARRLDLDGKDLELTSTTMTGSSFDIKSVKAKVVLVYFWASWNQQCAGDFVKLKTLLTSYGPKGLEVVGISLDDSAQAAKDFVQRNSAPGTELYEQGGMSSKLSEQFGIQVLPTMFLVKEGKVVNHNAQITTVEDELKKMLP